MYQDVTFGKGVGRASVAAGPVFLAAVAVFTTISMPGPVSVDPSSMFAILLVVPAIVVGSVVALIPNLIGAALLATVACGNAGLRLPTVWGLIGGLLAGSAASVAASEDVVIAAFATTGAICALFCRSGTRWPD